MDPPNFACTPQGTILSCEPAITFAGATIVELNMVKDFMEGGVFPLAARDGVFTVAPPQDRPGQLRRHSKQLQMRGRLKVSALFES